MAIWEFAPGSPWNAIFTVFVMPPCISRSGFFQSVFRQNGWQFAPGKRVKTKA
jgi:hypothetical protein